MRKHVLKWKERELQEIKRLAEAFPVLAVASPERMPASLLQKLRKKLEGKAVIRVSKTRVARRALEASSIKAEKFLQEIEKSVALIFSSIDSFELYGYLKKNKLPIQAKPGMITEQDIIIPAGDTRLPPGPALSDLKAVGLKVRVQGATIAITEDKLVTKKGEAITKAVASTLSKLDIKPISVGLSIKACFENGEIFTAEILGINAEQVFKDFVLAQRNAINLAFNAEYFTRETIELLLVKGFNNAKALAIEANIESEETIKELLAKASAQAVIISKLIKENGK